MVSIMVSEPRISIGPSAQRDRSTLAQPRPRWSARYQRFGLIVAVFLLLMTLKRLMRRGWGGPTPVPRRASSRRRSRFSPWAFLECVPQGLDVLSVSFLELFDLCGQRAIRGR